MTMSVGWGDLGSWLTWHAGPCPEYSLFPVECHEAYKRERGVQSSSWQSSERDTPTSFYPREGSDKITDKSEQRFQYEFN